MRSTNREGNTGKGDIHQSSRKTAQYYYNMILRIQADLLPLLTNEEFETYPSCNVNVSCRNC